MLTSKVIENVQEEAKEALSLVIGNREEAMKDNFKSDDWFKIISGKLEIMLKHMIKDLEGVKEDVVSKVSVNPADDDWDPYAQRPEEDARLRPSLKPIGHEYDRFGNEK